MIELVNQPKTCRDCRHWEAHAVNAMNFAAPRQGNCRQGPPHASVVGNGQIASAFPVTLHSMEACGQFAERPGVQEN